VGSGVRVDVEVGVVDVLEDVVVIIEVVEDGALVARHLLELVLLVLLPQLRLLRQ
jgi:hypothetical protein